MHGVLFAEETLSISFNAAQLNVVWTQPAVCRRCRAPSSLARSSPQAEQTKQPEQVRRPAFIFCTYIYIVGGWKGYTAPCQCAEQLWLPDGARAARRKDIMCPCAHI